MSKGTVLIVIAAFSIMACFNEPYSDGKRTYTAYCENCHMADGTGLPPLYVPIQESEYLNAKINELPCLIKNGKQSSLMANVAMPKHDLSETDMINLINYMNWKWGSGESLNVGEIKESYKGCE